MIATWTIRDAAGDLVASGTMRAPMPADGAQAYDLALRVANAIEAAVIDAIGAANDTLPLLRAAE